LEDDTLSVRVQAPAIDGRANEALLAAVARALGLRSRQVRLLRGERSRNKLIEVELATLEELRARWLATRAAEAAQ
jgi:uncharacterized protein YggU (UPF0235/DUF167 family)